MKLAFVCNPRMGGSGILATELAKALARRGHEIHLIAERKPFRWEENQSNLFFHKVLVNDYPVFEASPHTLSLAGALADVIKTHQIDLIHAHYAVPYGASALLASQICGNTRLITTLHGTDVAHLSQDPALRIMIDLVLAKSDAVTCVSQELADQTVRLFPESGLPRVIPNFIAHDDFPDAPRALQQELRQQLGLDPARFYLVHASNFRPIKRIGEIIHGFARVERDDKHLLLIGDGPDRRACQALVHLLGIQSQVSFLGRVNNVAEWLGAADLNVQLSSYESFGLTLIEAMALGTPTIATASGGMPGVLGETGTVIPHEHPARVTEAIEHWMDRPEQLLAEQKLCVDRARQQYSLDHVCRQYEALYLQQVNPLSVAN